MEKTEITRASVNDLSLLQAIGRQTFAETFTEWNTPENMEKYLTESFAAEKLTAELSNPEAEFYFAKAGQQVIGYLKLNFGAAQTEPEDQHAMEIERIYVVKAFQGKAVGQLLYDTAIQRARQQGAAYVWLGVWENNHRALRFYQKNGFTQFGKHLFRLGQEEQTDLMMKLKL